MTLARSVAAETLDALAADDPAARRSRRDLQRVHRAMGTRSIMLRAWPGLTAAHRGTAPLRVLELGAGDGSLMLGVARTLALAPGSAPVELTLLDRLALVEPATLARYAQAGWRATAMVADVLDWAASAAAVPGAGAAPARAGAAAEAEAEAEARAPASGSTAAWSATGHAPARWDLIVAHLFLHHFEGARLAALLGAIAARSDAFFACEPRRARLALAASHLVGALGANAVTREDAVLSVHAGFRAGELSALWPAPRGDWQLHEHPAGLFSHCLRAQRVRANP
ncbi:MAG: hypothetical protein KGL99_11155 [Burkholderiales bacterium]|nr:hypothetical protein [Burkholderiales bacterium]